MNILIAEDFRPMAKAIMEVLEPLGHTVTMVAGFKDLESLRAVDYDGKSEILLNAKDFDLAFVDGDLFGSFKGPEVVTRLVLAGVPCFGISTIEEMNAEMVANGAAFAGNKAVVFVLLIGGLFTAEAVVSRDESVAQLLSDCQTNFRTAKYKDMKRRADEAIARLFA